MHFICVHAVAVLVCKTVIACTHMKCKGLISDDFRPFFFLASFGFFFPHKENACDACRSSGNREKKITLRVSGVLPPVARAATARKKITLMGSGVLPPAARTATARKKKG